MTKLVRPDGTDLSSRNTAASLRIEIEQAVQGGQLVTIDLRHVLSISESFADELFGVLVARYGLSWLGEKVQIAAPHRILISVAGALKERLERSGEQDVRKQIHQLLVAKRARSLSADA